MKILAIRGKNLASLENEFAVDFTSEPLQSAGIFAITGPTGAGKSTLLDALCLALFDDAPRLSKAEQLKIEDENLDNITLKDSRNILRKGTAEGYAEVDFVALNGDKYRSRWMVRRARGKADGALQNTSIKLENLSTQTEEQGTKKDILNRITEVIGLTFDQFTRAVLLAQGDFATFLKARQNEKAELLEKLTGTEIYSKISALIFQKTNEAKTSLDIINQRKADIKLLTDEEFESAVKEKESLQEETEPIKEQLSVIEKKLNWIKDNDQLKKESILAKTNLTTVQSKIEDAAKRYEYISMLDSSQEIRDSYIELINKQKQQISLSANLQLKETELKTAQEKAKIADENLKVLKVQVEELDQKYLAIRPDIDRAKELDIQIKSTSIQVSENQKNLELHLEASKKTSRNIAELQVQLQKAKETKVSIEKWFDDHKQYDRIIPRIDLIINLLKASEANRIQKDNTLKDLESSKTILQSNTNRLKQQEEEAERLNNLLPSEILSLREKLEEGYPCPVCGNTHHHTEIFRSQQDSINESELNTAKKKIAEDISRSKESIDLTQKNITIFQTHISGFEQRYAESIEELKKDLNTLPNWEIRNQQGILAKELSDITTIWNENKVKLETCSISIETNTVKLEAEQKSLEISLGEIKQRSENLDNQSTVLKKDTEERLQILKGKSIDEIEKRYTYLKEDYSNKHEQQRQLREKAEAEKSTVSGIISQLKNDIENNLKEITRLEDIIQTWLNHNSTITPERLQDLMSKSKTWIDQEKAYLNDLKKQELIQSTTLDERNIRLQKHQEKEEKPEESLTLENLQTQSDELSAKQQSLNNRLMEIHLTLSSHQQNKERLKGFEAEIRTKEELYNNWAKLNDLLGSANGNKFKAIAQGYTLDVLLGYANKHLEELSKRYKLEKIPNTLALQVIDNDMLGEVRTVHSLSGGESFLISLSLALGLSSLSSNRMKIESLFIDEGFGSLDIDTLGIAMDALESLQTQGRKIGVISHVEEMKERISTQIQVTKSANGKSVIKVIG